MTSKEALYQLERDVNLGLKEAYKKMVIFKKRMNSPLIVSRDGKVVAIPPNEIPVTTKAKHEMISKHI